MMKPGLNPNQRSCGFMVTRMNIELLGETNIYFGLGIEIVTALLLGGLVGLDREVRMKSAGIRTNILICLGATLYTALSLLNQSGPGMIADPNRTAAQVVSGIGFLGAGAIIQSRGSVVGLTTAATIWVVAAVGVTIGLGYPLVAIIFTLTVLVVLELLNPVYRMIESEKYYKNYHIQVLTKGATGKFLREILLREEARVKDMSEEVLDANKDHRLVNLFVSVHPRKISGLSRNLKGIVLVDKVSYRVLAQ